MLDGGADYGTPIYVDFVGGSAGHRRRFGGGRGQEIAKACGLKGGNSPSVLDATAGLGGDSFVLASLGCRIVAVERNPLLAQLFEDGLRRASHNPQTAAVAERIRLHAGDAVAFMQGLAPHQRPQVVYLDPMYPQTGKSAQNRKAMRMFRDLVGEDTDANRLLERALTTATKRVVVKRPLRGQAIAGPEPSHSIRGKTTRFDVYMLHPENG